MVSLDDYKDVRSCLYKEREYLVRDNGCVFRKSNKNKKGVLDDKWTFGRKDSRSGYMLIGSERVHRIVATAFHGEPSDKELVVDHIDTNRANNRPENLRWVTKLENALGNPITRAKIIFLCGSIEKFLEDPSILYMYSNLDKNISWMRTVTKEEACISRERLEEWAKRSSQSNESSTLVGKPLNDWIFQKSKNKKIDFKQPDDNIIVSKGYHSISENDSAKPALGDHFSSIYFPLQETINETHLPYVIEKTENIAGRDDVQITDSLTSNAKQVNWFTPTEFPQCPHELSLQKYFDSIKIEEVFSKNSRKIGKAVDKEWLIPDKLFYVLCKDEEGFNQWLPTPISVHKDYFLHFNCGCWYYESIARKAVREKMLNEAVTYTEEESYYL